MTAPARASLRGATRVVESKTWTSAWAAWGVLEPLSPAATGSPGCAAAGIEFAFRPRQLALAKH